MARQQFAVVECSFTVRAPNPPQPRHSDADAAWRLTCHDRRQDYNTALQPRLDSVRLQIDFVSTHFYPDVNVLVLLTILSPQLNCYSVMPTILFFHRVLINSHYVLQLVLPQQHETQYNLRARQHDRLLIPKTAELNYRDFIVRMLYKSCY